MNYPTLERFAFLLGTGKNTSKKIIFNMELQKSDLSEICASLDDVYMPLFKHPLLEAFLYVKWKSIRWFYLLNLILYVFFLSVTIVLINWQVTYNHMKAGSPLEHRQKEVITFSIGITAKDN